MDYGEMGGGKSAFLSMVERDEGGYKADYGEWGAAAAKGSQACLDRNWSDLEEVGVRRKNKQRRDCYWSQVDDRTCTPSTDTTEPTSVDNFTMCVDVPFPAVFPSQTQPQGMCVHFDIFFRTVGHALTIETETYAACVSQYAVLPIFLPTFQALLLTLMLSSHYHCLCFLRAD